MSITATVKTHILAEAARVASDSMGRTIPANTVWGWVTSGKLRGRKIGGRWYINAADLESFLNGPEKVTA